MVEEDVGRADQGRTRKFNLASGLVSRYDAEWFFFLV